ncbi:MAG: ABC-type transport auxiliary lipoprotein family protein [Desulfatibacillaceae bacterium]
MNHAWMTRPALLLTALLLALGFTAAGCESLTRTPPRQVTFYTLEYDSPEVGGGPLLPVAVRVAGMGTAPAYDTRSMIYRDEPYTRNVYHYHKWRARPGDLVTWHLARDMRHAGLFKAVTTLDGGVSSTHLLEGIVTEFYELDQAGGWKAVFGLSVTLVDRGEADLAKRVLLTREYMVEEPADEKRPRAVAGAMSRAVRRVSGQLIMDMYEALAPAGPSGK